MIKCKICGQEYKSEGFAAHLKHNHPEYNVKSYYDTFIKSNSEGKCKTCRKKPTRFAGIDKGYLNYCSTRCAMKSPTVRKRISERTKAATEDIKKRNMAKYNVEWTTQLESMKQKSKETSLSKYGEEHPMKSKEVQAKRNKSTLEHLGVEFATQLPEIQQKIKQTNLEKLGVECPLSQPKVHEKAIQNAQLPEAVEKRKQTNIEKYGVHTQLERKEIQELAQTDEAKNKRVLSTQKTMLTKYNVSCGYQILEVREKALQNTHSIKAEEKRIQTRLKNGNVSSLEKLFMQLADSIDLNYVSQYHSKAYPYICDFYLPNSDTYIEINGFWTHNNHWFDETNVDDIAILEEWKAKKSKFYDNAIYTWSKLDVKKRDIAKTNNLNYVVLWSANDIYKWFSLNCPIGKDWDYEYSWQNK